MVDQAKSGIDPTADRRPARRDRDTVAAICVRYLEEHQRRNKLRTAADVERMLAREVLPEWGARPVQSITRRDVLELVNGIAGRAPVMANRIQSVLKRLFAWAVGQEIVEASPVAGMRPPAKEKSRERVLTDQELVAVWQGCEAIRWPHGPVTRLLLLTGARRAEVTGLTWAELDLDRATWTKPAERVKAGHEQTLPLSAAAVELLRAVPRIDGSALVFPSSNGRPIVTMSQEKARLDQLAGVTGWTHHDLRRTVASGLAALGVKDLVIAAVLDHSRSGLIGVTSRYNRHRFEKEQRAALELWGAHVLRLAAGGGGTVVPLHAG
jgi:integrase